jgi:nucleotide-binding universal stress UspA family protein
MPPRVIVVGTDGTERGAGAVREALGLARASGATLHVVHVVHPAVEKGQVESQAWQATIDDIRGEVDSVRSALLAEAEQVGVPMEFHTPGGNDVVEVLITTADAVHADLLVVGNRGMKGASRFVLGSIPNKVAHHARCSVLIANTEQG